MDIREKHLRRLLVVFFLSISFLLPQSPINTSASALNPPPAEIAAIFDEVGKQKQIPPVILKAIAYTESGWRQWDSNGNVVMSYWNSTPNIGIMQVGSYDPKNTALVGRLKNDIRFNIEYGAEILRSKWEATPRIGDGDPNKLENWYFALWAYNGWVTYNNPNNAQAAGRETYQDKIIRLIGTEYYKGLVEPSEVTPVPAHLIPTGTLPDKNTSWKTPEPFHYGGLEKAAPLSDDEINLLETVKRLAGKDRIGTALKIASEGWPAGSETVIIARSDEFSDALAGVALAIKYDAPILLTSGNHLDPRVEKAVLDLKPLRIIILGGKGAIAYQVEQRLKEVATWTDDIRRIAGKDRFETAVFIASELPDIEGVALATGNNFPDALSLAAAAGAQGYPLLLVAKDTLPKAAKDYLRNTPISTIYIAGGESVITPESVETITQVTELKSEQVKRISGKNRYETSALIVQEFYPEVNSLFLATGEDFPDALAGAALAGKTGTPLLLIPPSGPKDGSSTQDLFKNLSSETELAVFGGQKAIYDSGILKIKKLMQ